MLTFEACLLWGMKEEVPEEEYRIPFGVGRTVREGGDVTVVAISNAVVEVALASYPGFHTLAPPSAATPAVHRPGSALISTWKLAASSA